MRRFAALALCLGAGPVLAADPLLKNRDPGAHVIGYEVTLEAPLEEVFGLWSTADGLKRFMAPGARVDGDVGGLYQITFDPEGDPEGARHGTRRGPSGSGAACAA